MSATTSLTENMVINHVCDFLNANGYAVESTCSTNKQGVDVVARHARTGRRLRLEAKGATSSKPASKRYGKPFDSAQAGVHVAEAFYTAATLAEKHAGDEAGVALPNDSLHRARIEKVREACRRLGLHVYVVDGDGTVRRIDP